jgi:hypothetical protein
MVYFLILKKGYPNLIRAERENLQSFGCRHFLPISVVKLNQSYISLLFTLIQAERDCQNKNQK